MSDTETSDLHEDGQQVDHDRLRLATGVRLLISIPEAARLLSIGRSKAYELVGSGELESVHIGRAARVPVDALAQYVGRLRTQGDREVARP